ncbi:MAG: ABC transporter permease, partial [Chloroflexi bacterium]|nr:ABC transporter permease [Chloroflexota bacterium]
MGKIPRAYLLRRLGIFFLTIWFAATLIFFIPRLAPGDPITAMVGAMQAEGSDVEDSQAIIDGWRARFGLDESVGVQYIRYLGNLITFDFGYSIKAFPTPVGEIIARALPWTIGLLVVAMFITFFLGNFLGAILIWRHTPRAVKWFIPMTMVFTSIPSILASLLLLYIFAFVLNWFPPGEAYDKTNILPGLNLEFIGSVIYHGTLPALSIVLVSFGYWALGMRGMMITVEGEDYMQLAYAKGLKPFYVLYRYMIRNAILPQITAFAITLGTLVSGQV